MNWNQRAQKRWAVKKENKMNWIKSRLKERTTWDGVGLVGLGMLVLFMAPLAKIAAGIAIAWGAYTIWKRE